LRLLSMLTPKFNQRPQANRLKHQPSD